MLAVFVNSSDGFRDCWDPFFKLLEAYGGALRTLPVYLNSERARFEYGGIDIRSTCVWPLNQVSRPSWSECLLHGLDRVTESHVLYLQEDYFLTQPVRMEIVDEAMSIYEQEPDAGVIYLSANGPRVRKTQSYARSFEEVVPPAPYLINTQAAIWNKQYLRSLVRCWENAWMFEKFASLRERATTRRILTISPDALKQGDAIRYVWSGVIKGKWKHECVDLFQEHDIKADFAQRGFYREGSLLKYRIEVLHKLFGRPMAALKSISSVVAG